MRTKAGLSVLRPNEIDYVFGTDTAIDYEINSSSIILNLGKFSAYRLFLNNDCSISFDKSEILFGWNGQTYKTISIVIAIIQTDIGSKTVAWPQNVYWQGGIIPTLSTAINTVDIFTITTNDGGNSWFGSIWGKGFKLPSVGGITLPPVYNLSSTTVDNVNMTISWNISTDQNVTHYRVYNEGSLVATVGVSTNSYVFPLEVGQARLITVRTFNAILNITGPITEVVAYNPVPPTQPKRYYINGFVGGPVNQNILQENQTYGFPISVDYSADWSAIQPIQSNQTDWIPTSITATTTVDGATKNVGTVSYTGGTNFSYTVGRMIKGYTSGTLFKTETPVKITITGPKNTSEFTFNVKANDTSYVSSSPVDKYSNTDCLTIDIRDGEPDTDLILQAKITDKNGIIRRDDSVTGWALKFDKLNADGDFSIGPMKLTAPSTLVTGDGGYSTNSPTMNWPIPSETPFDNNWLFDYPLNVKIDAYSPKKYQWKDQAVKKLDVDQRQADWYKIGTTEFTITTPFSYEDNFNMKSFKSGTGPLWFKITGAPAGAKVTYDYKGIDATGFVFHQNPADTPYTFWANVDANGVYDIRTDSRFAADGGTKTISIFRKDGRVLKWPHTFSENIYIEWKGKQIKVANNVIWYTTFPTVLNCSTQGITGYPPREINSASTTRVPWTITGGEPGANWSYDVEFFDRYNSRIFSKYNEVPSGVLDSTGTLSGNGTIDSAGDHGIPTPHLINYPIKAAYQIYMYTGADKIALGPITYYIGKPQQRLQASTSGITFSNSTGATISLTVWFGPANSSCTYTRTWSSSKKTQMVQSGTSPNTTDAYGHITFSTTYGPGAFTWLLGPEGSTPPASNQGHVFPITETWVYTVGGIQYTHVSTITA